MNKSITAKELRHIVTGFRKIVPRQPENARVLKLDLAAAKIIATDGVSFLSYQLVVEKETNSGDQYLIRFDDLADFVKGLLARQEVIIEAHAGKVTLTTDGRRCIAQPMNPETVFPEPPESIGKVDQVSPADRHAILRAFSCASTDDSRPVLQGACLDASGSVSQAVGTDGRCLYRESLKDLRLEESFILPAFAFLKWRGLGEDWILKVSQRKNEVPQLRLSAGPWVFHAQAIEGNFPNWRQVIPAKGNLPSKLSLHESDLATLQNISGDTVGISYQENEVSFLSHEGESKRWTRHPTRHSKCTGPACQIFVDPKLMRRALDAGVIDLRIGEPCEPMSLRTTSGGEMVIMPMRVSGPEIPEPDTQPKIKATTSLSGLSTVGRSPRLKFRRFFRNGETRATENSSGAMSGPSSMR